MTPPSPARGLRGYAIAQEGGCAASPPMGNGGQQPFPVGRRLIDWIRANKASQVRFAPFLSGITVDAFDFSSRSPPSLSSSADELDGSGQNWLGAGIIFSNILEVSYYFKRKSESDSFSKSICGACQGS